MISRAYRFRIYPTPAQEAQLIEVCGAVRFVYNLAVEQRRDWWRQFKSATGLRINWASQSKELTGLRAEADWLARIPRSILEQSLRDVEAAFSAFFRGSGFPRFRSKDGRQSFRIQGREAKVRRLNRKWGDLKLGTLPAIKARLTRDPVGSICNVTVSREAGRWYASLACQCEADAPANSSPAIGIDRGIARSLSLSTGEHLTLPDMSRIERKRRAAARQVSRCKKGSARRLKAKQRLTIASAKVANVRKDWLHRASTDIAHRFGFVAIEALNVSGMTAKGRGKRGLNRSILNQGWSMFAAMLAYKLEERGGRLELVNPAYTSQQCSACGVIDKGSRESQASFRCLHCGHAMNADHNAAINILRRSSAGVEGAGYRPVEARTGEMSDHLENLAA